MCEGETTDGHGECVGRLDRGANRRHGCESACANGQDTAAAKGSSTAFSSGGAFNVPVLRKNSSSRRHPGQLEEGRTGDAR